MISPFWKKNISFYFLYYPKMTTKIILENEITEEERFVFTTKVEDMSEEQRRIADKIVEKMLEETDKFIEEYLNN